MTNHEKDSTVNSEHDHPEPIPTEATFGMGKKEYPSDMREQANKGFVHIRDTLAKIYEQLRSSKNCGNEPCGIPTGFHSLDDMIGGLRKGDLILIGASPGKGKTSFATNIAAGTAINTEQAVCFFSLEEEAETIVTRMLSAKARIAYRKLRSHNIQSSFEWKSIAYACAGLSEMDILIDATPAITVSYMKSQLRCVKNLGLVVVDYLQLVKSDESAHECRTYMNDSILRELKVMAGELDVPVICCTQLSFPTEEQSDRRPVMTDFKNNCDAAEEYANIVLFLHRGELYTDELVEYEIAEVVIAKNHVGFLGSVKLGWDGGVMEYYDLDNGREQRGKKG